MTNLDFIRQLAKCGDKASSILLSHGMAFPSVHAIKEPRYDRQCFKRALRLILRNPRLVYCEGYAMVRIPCLHAWCVDEEGRIHDPTWGNHGTNYFGVAFQREFALSHHRTHDTFDSLLDNWRENWPLLSLPETEWRHQEHTLV